jgi:hypothetical protein
MNTHHITLHPVNLTRKVSLCSNADSHAETAQRVYFALFTNLSAAKRDRLEPWAYLRNVLLRMSAGERDLEPLLLDR